jgi:2-hydroxychromene-2-carboxylate isomerase
MRAATALYKDANFEIFINCIFKAIWIDGLNMGDESVVESVLIQNKLNSTKILEQIKTDEVKQTLIKNTEKAINKGLFGVPTIFVGDEMFFGQDRLDFVEAILEKPIK